MQAVVDEIVFNHVDPMKVWWLLLIEFFVQILCFAI